MKKQIIVLMAVSQLGMGCFYCSHETKINKDNGFTITFHLPDAPMDVITPLSQQPAMSLVFLPMAVWNESYELEGRSLQ